MLAVRKHQRVVAARHFSLPLPNIARGSLQSGKHRGVRHFEVRSWGTPNEVHLTVSDGGSGFNKGEGEGGRGLGLISMHERLKILNGTLWIESQLQLRTTIHALVPINPVSLPAPTA
jgi:signal transduction histidine kinase